MRPCHFWAAAFYISVALTNATAFADENLAAGEKLFAKCKTCHSLEAGANKVGPSLYGVFGRTAGTDEGFNYSDAMKSSGIVWDETTLDQYLTKPKQMVPGTKMTFPGLKDAEDRAALIAYLKQATQPQ